MTAKAKLRKTNPVYNNTPHRAELLIPKQHWIDPVIGDLEVLTSPVMEDAHNAILEKHEPKYRSERFVGKTVMFSLCTATRPYSNSFKYKTFLKRTEIREGCDIVICSNAGIIPLEYELSYPFMTYDSPRVKKNDAAFNYLLKGRMREFLTQFKYEHVIVNAVKEQRFYKYSLELMNELVNDGTIYSAQFAPNAALREEYKTWDKSYHQKLNPDTHPKILESICTAITSRPVPNKVIR